MSSEVPRRRATSAGIASAKAARNFTGEYRARLATWHKQLAHLRARAMRADIDFVRSEVTPLLAEIVEQRQRFIEALAALPDAVRVHSIVRDVERAISRLQSELHDLGRGLHNTPATTGTLNGGSARSSREDIRPTQAGE